MLLWLVLLAGIAVAGPDARGDWPSCEGPVLARPPSGTRMPGALWRVVAPGGLVGRRRPGTEHPVVRRFAAGTVLQADVGRGGSDEVWVNARDSAGRPWMQVRTREGVDLNCYVRAHERYIQPVTR